MLAMDNGSRWRLPMLIIRDVQMEAFAQAGRQRLIKRMIDRVQRIWPEECQRFGDKATRNMVDSAVTRAFHYELTTEYDVVRFVDLVFAFESTEFDSSDWASEILKQSINPRRRMNMLWEKASEQLKDA